MGGTRQLDPQRGAAAGVAVEDRLAVTTCFTVEQNPYEVYGANNDVRGWWEENLAGRTHEVWRVLDNWMSFIDEQNEWTGTEIRFDITATDGGTEVRFTHVGLTPADQCFELCRDAWGMYLTKSLPAFIATGVGRPVLNEDGVRLQELARVGRGWAAEAAAGLPSR